MSLRQSLLKATEELKHDVILMADLALNNIKEGLKAFKEGNLDLAKEVIKKDELVNYYEEEIAKKALRIIWKEQPVAFDLRFVSGVLKLITDIERIGDHASDIAEMTLHLETRKSLRIMPITNKMTKIVETMVLESIDALLNVNEAKAKEVITLDDEVDNLFNELVTKIAKEIKEDMVNPNEAIYSLMVAKYIERIGDHAVNIAEWIIFIKTGTHKQTFLF